MHASERPWAPYQRSWKPGGARTQAQQNAGGYKQNTHCVHPPADAQLQLSRTPRPHMHCTRCPTRTKMEVKSKCAQHERHSRQSFARKQPCNADLYNNISAWFGNVGPGTAGQHNLAEPISHAYRRNAEAHANRKKETYMS